LSCKHMFYVEEAWKDEGVCPKRCYNERSKITEKKRMANRL